MELQRFLKDTYVKTGMAAVGYLINPISSFMRHLLVVQGIDPNTIPGQRFRKDLETALEVALVKDQFNAYSPNYDLNWVKNKFKQVSEKYPELSEEKFAALTDLSKLTDAEDPSYVTIQANGNEPHDPSSVINTIAPECQKRELRLEEPSDSAKDKDVSRGVLPGNPIADLRSAIANIEKELGLEDEPKKGVKTSKKRVNRAPSTRSKKKVPAKIQAQIKQATELVNKMVDRGLCAPDPDAVHEQLQQLLRFDPNALASLERVVDRHVPQVPADFGAKGGRMSRTTEKKEPKFNGNFRRYNKLKDE